MAIALSSSGCVHSRNTNVALCRTGKVGINRTKNMCRHSSRNTDVMDFAFTSAATLEDCIISPRYCQYTKMGLLTELVTISVTSLTA